MKYSRSLYIWIKKPQDVSDWMPLKGHRASMSMVSRACEPRSLPDLENATAIYKRSTRWTFIARRYAVCRADARFLLVYLLEQESRETHDCTRRRCLVLVAVRLVCLPTLLVFLLYTKIFDTHQRYIELTRTFVNSKMNIDFGIIIGTIFIFEDTFRYIVN